MKFKIVCASALLLAGCQLTQVQSQNIKETNSPATAKDNSTPLAEQNTTIKTVVAEPVVVTPQQQQDVWRRIGMQLDMTVPENSRVKYYRNWYLKHPSHLYTVSKRAQPFLYMITEKVEARGLPLELALLPIVESSFDPFAYSHGRAAGLWQFIPDTATRFGLDQNWWYDGRRDVDKATDAALDLMVYLNKKFNGDWLLALAAYNTGEGRVFRAIRKNKALGKPTDYWSLDLPKETSGYVPKLLALSDIIAHPNKYKLDIPAISNKQQLASVDPKIQMDLAVAASYAGISTTELQSYNPGYNRWATAPSKQTAFLLPVRSVSRFNQQLASHNNQGLNVIRYKVKSGDTLSVLAEKHKTTTALIKKANQLSSNNIRVGRYLMIPVSTQSLDSYTLSMSQRLEKIQSTNRGGKIKMTHTIKSGDSFWTIAKKYNVSYKSIPKWNGMSPRDPLKVGHKLVIWQKAPKGGIIRPVTYKVRNGDSLGAIANKFKVSVSNIIKWNQIKQDAYLQPGQRLKLYVDVTKVSI
ncbi:LysM peptidoglycan-binding domain-containing protein [Vibrio sp. SS-MA-C1-2]|uniref:LysM peptidoglycan-binding domain-containing protein n=1 Tax=Vibrio sp. SS-MA-C1-2 TaxID=2908646 RepID=UPI001F376E13|nr:LysM peptidoglycan-binding domain-containing protein [Vibrio sp. SS-MA-C1-2]UJF19771.1 LysM peptidoglycan-binding domain-containing protein [Vibrio sp. SS-MA-C1-2]